MSWSPLSWLVGGYSEVQQTAAIESIPKPQGAKYYFGPQAYTEHKLGKVLDNTIPPIPNELIECLSKPSPFPPDWNRPIGETHLLIYIPGKMALNPNQPTLHSRNFSNSSTNLKIYYETYSGQTALPPSWFLVPLNAQPNYDINTNPQLTFPGPESDMQYSSVGAYNSAVMYIPLEILKLPNTEIKYLEIPGSDYLTNQIWSLKKVPS